VTGGPGIHSCISAGATSPRPWAPNGSVWSWGSDDNGQLGVVLTSSPATRPVNTIAAGSGIVQLAAGAEHMLALKSDGAVVARATTSTARSATARRQNISGQVQVTGLTIATQIAAGGASSFAVRTVAYLLGS
jgi:alpha-tubulin suppressor-like RCC1 family protein